MATKLKPNYFVIIYGSLVVIAATVFVILTGAGYFSERTLDFVMMIVFIHATLDQLILLFRTKNWYYLFFLLLYTDLFLFNLTVLKEFNSIRTLLGIIFAVLIFPVLYALINKKIKPRGRQILEIAAYPVHSTEDGFTGRPMSIGKQRYSKEQIRDFAGWIRKKLIALPYAGNDRIFLVIIAGEFNYTKMFRPGLQKSTYVCYDFEGNVSISISKSDYKKYRDELTFDQLCNSLGSLFNTFLQLYLEGKSEEIIPLIEERFQSTQVYDERFHQSAANGG